MAVSIGVIGAHCLILKSPSLLACDERVLTVKPTGFTCMFVARHWIECRVLANTRSRGRNNQYFALEAPRCPRLWAGSKSILSRYILQTRLVVRTNLGKKKERLNVFLFSNNDTGPSEATNIYARTTRRHTLIRPTFCASCCCCIQSSIVCSPSRDVNPLKPVAANWIQQRGPARFTFHDNDLL